MRIQFLKYKDIKVVLLMRLCVLLIFCLCASQSFASENILVELDEVQVNKSTKADSSWNFMDVNLYLTGDGLESIKWYYGPVYTSRYRKRQPPEERQ